MLSDLNHNDRLLDSRHTRKTAVRFAPAFAPPAPATGAKPDTASAEISTDVSYLPDLHAYLDDLLRNRERVLAAAGIDQWARAEAVPSQDEISRIRRLIGRIENGLDDLTAAEREQIGQAVAIVRRHRTVTLGMPRLRRALPDIRPERPA
jgi:hypothetical protein